MPAIFSAAIASIDIIDLLGPFTPRDDPIFNYNFRNAFTLGSVYSSLRELLRLWRLLVQRNVISSSSSDEFSSLMRGRR